MIFNSPTELFDRLTGVKDDKLVAYIQPKPTGRIGKHIVYDNHRVALTVNGRIPWIPVTMAEDLDYEERAIRRRLAELAQSKAEPPRGLDEARVRETYEALKKTDPAKAEDYLKMMDKVRQIMQQRNREVPERLAKGHALWQKELDALLSPADLQAQARLSYTRAVPDAPIGRLVPLVKPDPAFPWDQHDENRIQLISCRSVGKVSTRA